MRVESRPPTRAYVSPSRRSNVVMARLLDRPEKSRSVAVCPADIVAFSCTRIVCTPLSSSEATMAYVSPLRSVNTSTA